MMSSARRERPIFCPSKSSTTTTGLEDFLARRSPDFLSSGRAHPSDRAILEVPPLRHP